MAPPSQASSILLRKRTSDGGSRRRSGQLGAVKALLVKVEEESAQPSQDVPAEPSAAAEEPQQPEGVTPAEPPAEPSNEAADAPTTRFQRQLADSNATDRWFEDQLTPKAGPSSRAKLASENTAPVQSAASQIVDKALRYITSDRKAETGQSSSGAVFKRGTSAILDKGLDAFSGMGKLMESFATTLDSVIGQAFEEWGTPKSSDRHRPLQPRNGDAQQLAGKGGSSAAGGAGMGARGSRGFFKQTHMTTFMSKVTDASEEDVAEWHKRALTLQAELQKLQTQIAENQRLRDEYVKIQEDLEKTASTVSKLEEENTLLKQRTVSHSEGGEAAEIDPLAAEQVRLQMEALLTEKAKLAQENARLLRENTGLQELLEFTMMTQAELVGDDELWPADDPPATPWATPPASYHAASSMGDASPRSTDGCIGQAQPPTGANATLAL